MLRIKNNSRIRKISSAGVVTTLAGSSYGYYDGTGTDAKFRYPMDVAVDGSGTVFVADQNNHLIRKILADGTVTTLAGSGSSGNTNGTGTEASFYSPGGLDVDDNGQLDFIVATWVFGGQGDIYAYTGDSALLIWEDTIPSDFFYHGASFADIDGDNKPELTIGCYDGNVYALNAEDGSHLWTYFHPDAYPQYVGAPTSIADLNNDELYEIVFINGNRLGVLSNTGDLLWDYPITGYSTSF